MVDVVGGALSSVAVNDNNKRASIEIAKSFEVGKDGCCYHTMRKRRLYFDSLVRYS